MFYVPRSSVPFNSVWKFPQPISEPDVSIHDTEISSWIIEFPNEGSGNFWNFSVTPLAFFFVLQNILIALFWLVMHCFNSGMINFTQYCETILFLLGIISYTFIFCVINCLFVCIFCLFSQHHDRVLVVVTFGDSNIASVCSHRFTQRRVRSPWQRYTY